MLKPPLFAFSWILLLLSVPWFVLPGSKILLGLPTWVVWSLGVTVLYALWKLTVLKLELLVQAAPAVILGVRSWRPDPRPLVTGLIVGVVVTVVLKYSADLGWETGSKPLGINAGMWGLLVNVVVLLGFQVRSRLIKI